LEKTKGEREKKNTSTKCIGRREEGGSAIMLYKRIKRRGWRAGVARGPTGGKGEEEEDPRKERRSWAVAHKSRVACSLRL